MRRPGESGVLGARAVVTMLSVGVLAACGGSDSGGDSRAAEAADEVANALALRWTAPQANPPQPALAYATSGAIQLVTSEHPDGNVSIVPLRWDGTSDAKGAEVDVSISVRLPEDAGGGFGSTQEASSATRCYGYVIIANRNYDQVEHAAVSCPDGPAPALPAPPQATKLPDDTEKRVKDLLEAADAESFADAVQAAFTEEGVFARSAVDGGRLIMSVGTSGGGHCLVGVRERDGEVSFPGFPREWLQPGEIGCDPALVTNPPQ